MRHAFRLQGLDSLRSRRKKMQKEGEQVRKEATARPRRCLAVRAYCSSFPSCLQIQGELSVASNERAGRMRAISGRRSSLLV